MSEGSLGSAWIKVSLGSLWNESTLASNGTPESLKRALRKEGSRVEEPRERDKTGELGERTEWNLGNKESLRSDGRLGSEESTGNLGSLESVREEQCFCPKTYKNSRHTLFCGIYQRHFVTGRVTKVTGIFKKTVSWALSVCHGCLF